MKILFICTGNTCRSPMAAALAGKTLGAAVRAESAGLAVYGGAASRNAVAAMRGEGLDLSNHRARQVSADLLGQCDLALAMTRAHRDALRALYPAYTEKIFALGEYAGDNQDIPDPYGQNAEAYRACARSIKEKLHAVTNRLKREGFMPQETDSTRGYANLRVTEHPLVCSKVSMLRDKKTGNKEFRELTEEIAAFMCYEATRDVPLTERKIETPLCPAEVKICDRKFGIVPILRAGLGMVQGISNLLPTAKIGHIGMYRDPETLRPVEYYCKLPPDAAEREILLLDPMLATGRTAAAAVDYLKRSGVRQIKQLCLVAAPEGVEHMLNTHPDVCIYAAAYDDNPLNSHGYIVPGLGDAGDRLFGTR